MTGQMIEVAVVLGPTLGAAEVGRSIGALQSTSSGAHLRCASGQRET